MKILFIINSLCGGGAEKLLRDIILNLSNLCYCDVLVLTDSGDKYSIDLDNNHIIVNCIKTKTKIGTILYLNKYIINNNFDIVHANLFPTNYLCALAKLINKRKFPILITTEHNTDNRRRHIKLLRPFEKMIYSLYDHVISISEDTEKSLLKWLDSVPNERFSVIYNGVDTTFFKQAEKYERKELCDSLEDDDIILCMVGAFIIQKNHEYMLKIMKKLPDKFKLLLVGEGILEKKIKRTIIDNNLSDRVMMLGFRHDIARIMNTIDVLVIPSKWEGFGLVAVEAMACGKNIVAADVPGLSQVLGDVGFKIKLEDENEFINAIYSAVESMKDRIVVEKLISQSQKYDINLVASNYYNLFNKLKNEL